VTMVEREGNFLYHQAAEAERITPPRAPSADAFPYSLHLMMKQKVDNRSDEQLIQDVKGGDRVAFAALVKRYEDTVYKFSYKVCRDTDKAEEALQDTFINVYRKLDSFDGKSKFSTWLYSIVTNNCLMKRRRRKLDDLLESLDEPPIDGDARSHGDLARWDETPADLLLKKEFQTVLDRAIMKLPVDYRVVFVLRDLEDKSTEEAAEILRISVEATKSRLRRARAFLRKEIGPYMTTQGRASR
jgi:RNA polymerase sigma-70 factor, ECF subfamily